MTELLNQLTKVVSGENAVHVAIDIDMREMIKLGAILFIFIFAAIVLASLVAKKV